MRIGVGHQPEVNEKPTTTSGERAQGAGGIHSAGWGKKGDGGRAGGWTKTHAKVTIAGNRPPRLGGDSVSIEDMREILVAYSDYEQHVRISNRDEEYLVRARK